MTPRLELAGRFPKRIRLGQTRGADGGTPDREWKERGVVTVRG